MGYCSHNSCNKKSLCKFRTKIEICLNSTSSIRYHEYKQHNLDEILDLNEYESYNGLNFCLLIVFTLSFETGFRKVSGRYSF